MLGAESNPYAPYGSTSTSNVLNLAGEHLVSKRAKKHFNLMPMFGCWFVPSGLFCLVYWLLTCETRWRQTNFGVHVILWGLCFVVVASIILGTMVLRFDIGHFGAAVTKAIRWLSGIGTTDDSATIGSGRRTQGPTWSIFMIISLVLAWVCACILGNVTFDVLSPYYEVVSLNAYANVKTTATSGVQYMDAGSVTFTPGTMLDLSKAMGFQSGNVYCVVPIVGGANSSAPPASYDWWAVGMNCCNAQGTTFHCDGATDPQRNGGLRVMNDMERQFYTLAVQEASVAYNLKTFQPLFFHWVQDPLEIIDTYKDEGDSQFIMWIVVYCAFQAVFVGAAAYVFSITLRSYS